MPSDRELIRIQIETLFTCDARGRLLRVNEPSGKDAPRFFLGRTANGSEPRFGYDVDDDTVRALEVECASEPRAAELLGRPSDATRFERILAHVAPVTKTYAGPAYRFPEALPAPPNVVAVTEANPHVLRPHLAPWLPDVAVGQPLVAYLVDGAAVSICASVRIGTRAHEAGVETAAEFRGRGYAALAVTAWAAAVRALGRIPLYSTSWENTASRALARRLGLVQYGADLHMR